MSPHLHAALYSFLDLLAGLASIVGIAVLAKLGAGCLGIGRTRPAVQRTVELLSYLVAAAAGGYVTARISAVSLLTPHIFMLAMIVLVLSAISALQQRDEHPALYQIAVIACMPLAVVGGAMLFVYLLHRM